MQRAVLDGVSKNSSIVELTFGKFAGDEESTAIMAGLLEASTVLRWLELRSGTGVQMEVEGDIPGWSHVVEALSRNDSLRAAAKDIDRNHTLLTADCSDHLDADAARDYLAVQDTTSRNSGVVTRAARFLKASHLDRYVNGALERVLSYPALLTEVAEVFLNINQSELVSLARDRLKGTKSLDGFMRFAGVVKEGVLCHPSDDGRMQLDDLNEDCWMHVRRYLFIDDVKEGIGPP
ncbi:hypothetical protein HPB52_025225 [Rhipicephalus sanguineus]|uniref:Uncharacterized protein n=1 Tax=Rhipicephalus sanguineus TaxID=34632 RepID=A0A9D4TDA2_RHISA|nr:hypothetical protein HPB52_025225 [Rhipicephalus sanguineus]